ncbi:MULTISPECIES: rhodanese-like domain-containing protein [Selenomonas]|jgi:rhodanese domain protein|uniref:Rhodanese-like protein n=1 Tax=Selenomonas artemidis F0399 TaxID=749551 RepID=E7N1M0_9FIRM|nr:MULTISPECIES: rhodanese-like domain-containing protein [Selenomonas]EFR41517.1 rhodanese-like protein [Selenomonas sp. oral taxon 137 str. F0430]EFW29991.1 rhodanese-like protein [Selenomonas artemidis F0399]EJP30183.1 rhodanese-like protein [Selenomonas sp. FOBRC9]MBF1682369.1 rhodanese-like domain-containing protein [Selenomonas artemidis]
MKKFVAAVLLAAAAVTAFGCGQSSAATGSDGGQTAFRRVTGDEAQKMMESETGYLIVDVRTPQEYAEGHIPHAINVPLDTIGTNPPAELPDKAQMIFVYCRSGARSMTASNKLAQMGYTNIVEMGGIKDWHGEVVK